MFGLFKTDTEKKRDDYKKLHSRLQDSLNEHNQKINDAEASYSNYLGTIPYLSNLKIPSNDFDVKRDELQRELHRYLNYEKGKQSELTSAVNKAYERYEHYKNLAIREEEAEMARREEERKERLERLKNGFS